MRSRPLPAISVVLPALVGLILACASGGGTRPPADPGGSGGDEEGGAGGGGRGGGGSGSGGGGNGGGRDAQAVGEAGSGGQPVTPDAGSGSGGSVPDSAPPAADDAAAIPPASGQGPTATGTIRFSQDFEQNMDGMSRSPASLPEDRIQIVDDPVHQRGKVVRIMFKAGDDFRTSPGTQPRSWFSAAKGYTIKPGSKVSVAWGFMWENVNMNAHFAQIIRDGGPLWMWDVDGGGTVSAVFHRGSGGTGPIMKLEPMKWYDFMVVTDYRAGGMAQFYVNGKMVGSGRGDGGGDARWDCGIYTRPGDHPARTVYVSNVSIGEL